MNKIGEIFREFWSELLELLPNVVSAIAVIIVFTFIGLIVQRIISIRVRKRWSDDLVAQFMSRLIKWIFVAIGFIIGMHFVGFGGVASSIIAGAGVSAIIVGFAFKDIAENFLAGFLLAVNRPFKVGDIIETENWKGPVKKLDLRVTHIRTVDGRDIYIPNAMIVKNVLINYTKDGLLRQEFLLGLDTEADLEAARRLIMDYMVGVPVILKDPKPNMLVHEIGESSIVVKVMFWVDVFGKVDPKEAVNVGDTGETVKSRIMREVTSLLLSNGFTLPSVILEHKMYRSGEPLEVKVGD